MLTPLSDLEVSSSRRRLLLQRVSPVVAYWGSGGSGGGHEDIHHVYKRYYHTIQRDSLRLLPDMFDGIAILSMRQSFFKQ